MMNNPYEILGIREGANMDEIKRAYRKKAKEYHPDLHPDDPRANEKMQQINAAYDMLCNPGKYASQRQAGSSPDANGYGRRTYDGYARQGQPYGQGGWQYTYYANDRDAWQAAWQQAANDRQQRQAVRAVSPFRGIARFIGGIMLFRFAMTLLRLFMFGFLR